MSKPVRSVGSIRGAALAAALLLALSAPAVAQAQFPATACDAALANRDLHPQPEMPLEDGATAFSYTAAGATAKTAFSQTFGGLTSALNSISYDATPATCP